MCQCQHIVAIFKLFFTIALIGGGSGKNVANAIHWDNSVDLNEDYRVLWNIVGQEIVFEVQVRTLGYIGFGFSLDGKLPGSDVAIGWISQGHTYFQVSGNFYMFFLFVRSFITSFKMTDIKSKY